MNILIIANHYAVCSARYATDAFKRLGHKALHIGPAMGRNIWGLTLPPEYEWRQDDHEAARTQGFRVDLVLVMDSDPVLLETLDLTAWKALGVPVAVWGVDNHVRSYRREWFDHYFLAHRRVSVMDWAPNDPGIHPLLQPDGRPTWEDMTHLSCCYDPTLHTPSQIPFEDREYDVCMIGVMYPQRWRLVQALREAGLKVLAGTGLVYDSYVAAYHNSRISLCLSACGDVAQRVFETAAMGCVVMTDNCPDFELPTLRPNGFWLLDDLDPETVVQAARDILAEPEHAQAMGTRSMAWAAPHTWDARAAEIIQWAEGR